MSELDDFMTGAFTEAMVIIGTVSFTIVGITGTFTGVLDQVAKDREKIDGGFLADHDATLSVQLSQFTSTVPAAGMDLAIGSDNYRIAETKEDSVAYTLAIKRRVR